MFKQYFAIYLFLFVFHLGLNEIESKPRNILVFGGNGFIGSNTVAHFLQRGDNVTIVMRGNWYWDSETRIKPFVNVVNCDRKKSLDSCNEFKDLLNHGLIFEKFDSVVDFSAYTKFEMEEAIKNMKNKTKLYIYISTNSVYEVCDLGESQLIIEEMSIRPEDPHRKSLLANHYFYGHNKLEAEEFLIKQRSEIDGIPYISLRLPDVLGPRDTTHKYWIYHLWLKLASVSEDNPVTIPHFLENHQMSFVYVSDVGKLIKELTENNIDSQVLDQVFNIAWKDNLTLSFILNSIGKYLGIKPQTFKIQESEALHFFPSVYFGMIDVSKADKVLKWNPTPFQVAINETVNFYENAMSSDDFIVQRDEIIQIYSKQMHNKNVEFFYSEIEKIYKINLNHFKSHDEL